MLMGCPPHLSVIVGVSGGVCVLLFARPIRLLILRAALLRGGVSEGESVRWSFRAIYYPGSPDPTLTKDESEPSSRREPTD
jgi:hypothetical protein